MATISFKEDVYIRDNKKAKEILTALQQPRDRSIHAVYPPKLPKNANDMWFKHSNKII